METIKQQIQSILNTWIEANATEDKFKISQPDIEITGLEKASSEIKSFIKKGFVEIDFVEWMKKSRCKAYRDDWWEIVLNGSTRYATTKELYDFYLSEKQEP